MICCRGIAWGVSLILASWAGAALSQETQAPLESADSPYRKLAPGVLEKLPNATQRNETFSRHNVSGLLAVNPALDFAKDSDFRHAVWALEFQFKPVRMIYVDEPQPSGMMQRKLIWYMVYSVANNGKVLHPVADKELPYETNHKPKIVDVKEEDKPVRFVPQFLLEARENLDGKTGFTKVYPDRVIPVAVKPIRTREDAKRRFFTTVEMAEKEIAPGETVWGMVTWEDIDPKTDCFTIYIQGLTNAYRWKDEPGAAKPNDPSAGSKLLVKTLKLNFWRPSDEYMEHEREIRFGIPGEVDYLWVYR